MATDVRTLCHPDFYPTKHGHAARHFGAGCHFGGTAPYLPRRRVCSTHVIAHFAQTHRQESPGYMDTVRASPRPAGSASGILASSGLAGLAARAASSRVARRSGRSTRAGSSRWACWLEAFIITGRTHPLTKSAERRVSAAPRTMQARLSLQRCASARRWLLQVGAHAERRSLVREGTPVRRSRSCAPRSARDGLGRPAASVKDRFACIREARLSSQAAL